MKFGEAVAQTRAPGCTLILEPWVFSDEWSRKPQEAVCCGLRLLADKEKSKARFTAEELANELQHAPGSSNWVDAYNDALMRQVVALAICDPNIVTKPFELLPLPELDVSDAITSRGARFIFERIDRYEIESSPIGEQADDDDLQRLGELLPAVELAELSPGLRRLLSHVLDELEQAVGHLVEPAALEDAGDEIPVVVRGRGVHVGDPIGPA